LVNSVFYGFGVVVTSTFSSLYAVEFKEYNICNHSLIGYSTKDYVKMLRNILPNDSATELVTLFYCLNDVYGDAGSDDLPAMGRPTFIGRLNGLLQNRCATYKLIKLFFYQNSNRYFTYDLSFYKKDGWYFKNAMNQLSICDSLCKAKNIYFNVVMLPYQSQLMDKILPHSKWLNHFAKQISIRF